jgi:hypothetical protein
MSTVAPGLVLCVVAFVDKCCLSIMVQRTQNGRMSILELCFPVFVPVDTEAVPFLDADVAGTLKVAYVVAVTACCASQGLGNVS